MGAGWRVSVEATPGFTRGSASGDGWLGSGEFMCDGSGSYDYMGHDLLDRLTVSLLACPGELTQVYGGMNCIMFSDWTTKMEIVRNNEFVLTLRNVFELDADEGNFNFVHGFLAGLS